MDTLIVIMIVTYVIGLLFFYCYVEKLNDTVLEPMATKIDELEDEQEKLKEEVAKLKDTTKNLKHKGEVL